MAANFYNIARIRMLENAFDWRIENKWLILVGDGFLFVPSHTTLDQSIGPCFWQAGPILSPMVTVTGWAGSPPLVFVALSWPEPIYGAMITEVADGLDPTIAANHQLIVDLDHVIAYPFETDGRDKQISWNSAQGAQGWFAP